MAPKRPPKSIPGATFSVKLSTFRYPAGWRKLSRSQPLFVHRSRLPAAIVPPPGLGKIICMRKICKKFDARSMQVYFFAKYCLKRLISPTTNQNEHPRVQNNPNLALHGTKRDPIWAKRTPKWAQRVPKGRQKWARNQQKYHKKSQPRKRSKKGGQMQHLFASFLTDF